MSKQHEFKIKIEMQLNSQKREAYDKLKSWLEHYGHTSTGHGFAFQELKYLGDED